MGARPSATSVYVWRSALGVTADGALVYVGRPGAQHHGPRQPARSSRSGPRDGARHQHRLGELLVPTRRLPTGPRPRQRHRAPGVDDGDARKVLRALVGARLRDDVSSIESDEGKRLEMTSTARDLAAAGTAQSRSRPTAPPAIGPEAPPRDGRRGGRIAGGRRGAAGGHGHPGLPLDQGLRALRLLGLREADRRRRALRLHRMADRHPDLLGAALGSSSDWRSW